MAGSMARRPRRDLERRRVQFLAGCATLTFTLPCAFDFSLSSSSSPRVELRDRIGARVVLTQSSLVSARTQLPLRPSFSFCSVGPWPHLFFFSWNDRWRDGNLARLRELWEGVRAVISPARRCAPTKTVVSGMQHLPTYSVSNMLTTQL